jgi:hypothetical protein
MTDRLRHVLALLAAGILLGATPAPAQESTPVIVPVDGEDPQDGSRLTGVRLTSEDGGAYLFFLCDSDNTNPRIIFGHGSALDRSTRPVGFTVTFDGGESTEHFFTVLQNPRTAVFFVRTAEMYHGRFGESPPVFDKQTRAVNPDYIAWTDNVYNQITTDFFFAETAALRFTDADGTRHAYVFRLKRLPETIGRLESCLESPRVE